MRYLGVDYGTKKVGLAISDDEGSVAFPYVVIPNDDTLFEELLFLLKEENLKEVVIGHSLDMQGKENPVMEGVYTLKDSLEADGWNVHLEPEFLTTVQAKRNTSDTMADAAAAALILQSFLDKQQQQA